ncbi:MAG TPA: DUF6498-containing protein [Dokdonella sp.]|uniref:DUF6498-containing protein n=1 Tax=Dokdonella sp. TaxID=2291710 RepID=UPI002D7FA371|nr:DUF6498-containing protein [Dokdonella sp.]HET9031972.1 DUF6498-containing protein [Dokdonella sp.]
MKSSIAEEFLARRGLSAIGLIIANAAVLVIAMMLDLSLIQILIVYCWETIWIGVFCALRLIVASIIGNPYRNSSIKIPRIVSLIASIIIIVGTSSAFFAICGAAVGFVVHAESLPSQSGAGTEVLMNYPLLIAVSLVFVASHGLSFAINFLFLGGFRSVRVGELVAFPFKRSIALLLSILLGLVAIGLLPALASTGVFVLVVIVLKLAMDFYLYRDERRLEEQLDAEP